MQRQKIENLFQPIGLPHFNREYFSKKPFASPRNAKAWEGFMSWDIIREILRSGHKECLLPRQGKLPESQSLNMGILDEDQVLEGFKCGRTLLLRHAERSHSHLQQIAEGFHEIYQKPIDIQVYCTPPGQEGFGWHYDIEDVFVIQSSGEKEFYLRENSMKPLPKKIEKIYTTEPGQYFVGPEVRCHLKAGDWLYIPAGFWHKARAHNFSVHFSIGVLSDP